MFTYIAGLGATMSTYTNAHWFGSQMVYGHIALVLLSSKSFFSFYLRDSQGLWFFLRSTWFFPLFFWLFSSSTGNNGGWGHLLWGCNSDLINWILITLGRQVEESQLEMCYEVGVSSKLRQAFSILLNLHLISPESTSLEATPLGVHNSDSTSPILIKLGGQVESQPEFHYEFGSSSSPGSHSTVSQTSQTGLINTKGALSITIKFILGPHNIACRHE